LKENSNNKEIIDAILSNGRASNPAHPAIIFVVGRSCSGKSTFIREKIGDDFVRVDAGNLFFNLGGGAVAEFPGSLEDDINEVGRGIALGSLAKKFDLVIEFTGADTVRMQMLIRALADIGYAVDIKYVRVDLAQASVWNMMREDHTVPAHETDSFHFDWLVDGINSLHSSLELTSQQENLAGNSHSRRDSFSSLFGGLKGQTKAPRSLRKAQSIIEQFLGFSAKDASLIRSAANMPMKKSIIISAFELLLTETKLNRKSSLEEMEYTLVSEYRSVFEYQEIESFDIKLIEELDGKPSGRDISIRLTKDDVTATQEEDFELIRMNRKRLVQKYHNRAEEEYLERVHNSAEG